MLRDAKIALLLSWPFVCLGEIYFMHVFRTPAAVTSHRARPIRIAEASKPVAESVGSADVVAEPKVTPADIVPPAFVAALPLPALELPQTTLAASAPQPIRRVNHVEPLPQLLNSIPKEPAALMPLTGTYMATLDARRNLVLPKALHEQLGGDGTVLVSPGTTTCIWITTDARFNTMTDRWDRPGIDVRSFRRMFFAQAQKVNERESAGVMIPERFAEFAGLKQEVILVGAEDHAEVWDAARWRMLREEVARQEEE